TNRQGRQGKIYYGTQVTSKPPTIALFVNDPKRFPENYRRYIQSQFRQHLGFTGTPIRLLWRGKKAREVEQNTVNRATRV
ncbi:MAG: ribosome biogenesis GTPase Der, partial [Trichodesmium sp. St11_bin5]|nr:ribosome biogenesis GTPase Der [Trichodesmium sp. St11_bin5]